MSNSWKATPISKPTPLGRPSNSATSTIFQTSDKSRARGGRDIGRELRQDHVPERAPARDRKHRGHLVERRVERAGSLAQRDDGGRQLVDGDRRDRGHFGQPRPDIGEHDDDERRQIEQQDQPGIAQPIGEPHAAHPIADRRAQRHRQGEGQRHARERDAEVEEQRAGTGLGHHRREHDRRRRQFCRPNEQCSDPPGGQEHDK